MTALDTLTSRLLPERDDATFLKELNIIPSLSSSTTTNPYTNGGNPTNLQTGTSSSDVLQAIQRLDEKVTGGFAQVMAKLSNTPIKGGGAGINSQQSIEMFAGNSGTTTQPSLFNTARGLFGLGPAAPAASAANAPAANAPAAPLMSTSTRPKLVSTGSVGQITSSSSLSGGRRRRSRMRKSRHQRSRRSRRRRRN
jgi:hypothetical protein